MSPDDVPETRKEEFSKLQGKAFFKAYVYRSSGVDLDGVMTPNDALHLLSQRGKRSSVALVRLGQNSKPEAVSLTTFYLSYLTPAEQEDYFETAGLIADLLDGPRSAFDQEKAKLVDRFYELLLKGTRTGFNYNHEELYPVYTIQDSA